MATDDEIPDASDFLQTIGQTGPVDLKQTPLWARIKQAFADAALSKDRVLRFSVADTPKLHRDLAQTYLVPRGYLVDVDETMHMTIEAVPAAANTEPSSTEPAIR
jgi:hypothetical protein